MTIATCCPGRFLTRRALLRAFANYRIVTTYARIGDGRAENVLGSLLGENPEEAPGNVYAAMGNAFMEVFRGSGDATAACGRAAWKWPPDARRHLAF